MAAEIDSLPASCALIAMAACYQLARHGIDCRPMAIVYQRKPLKRHIVTVIRFEGRIRVYDYRGSVTMPKKITDKSKPIDIAKAWVPLTDFNDRPLGADWY